MKICAIADTHGKHWDLKIPKCDIFIFAGDANINSLVDAYDFNAWLGGIEVSTARIIIAGNHDRYLEEIGQAWCEFLFTNATYLQDKEIEVGGLKIYGSPWTPTFMSWAFMRPRRSQDLKKIWKQMPEDLDILITHGPPYKILDKTVFGGDNCGCEVLVREIYKKHPKYHLFGHIHECYGNHYDEEINTKFINCSVLDERYNFVNKPTIIDI